MNLHANSNIVAQLVVKVQGFKGLQNIYTHIHTHTYPHIHTHSFLSPYVRAVIPVTAFSFYSIWQLLLAGSTLTTPGVIHVLVHATMEDNVTE